MDYGNDGINIPRPPGNRWFPFFNGWTTFTPTLPKLYFGVDSVEQRYWLLCKQLHKLICYIDMVGDKVNINHDEIEQLKADFAEFMASGFDDYYREQIEAWVRDHMPDIISQYVKQVYFGLTLDGYFVAYIPEGNAWEDVIFDTGQVYDADDYGRLELFYPTDDNSNVWQESPYKDSAKMWKDLMDILSEMDVAGVQDIMDRLDEDEQAIYGPILESEVDA